MLTVKKFGALFNLSIGGYFAAFVGIIFAVLTIFVFCPDIDLADDEEGSSIVNSTVSNVLATTMATISASTEDPTPDDDDEEMTEAEKKDEINDTVLGVNICLIFFGWILLISSVLLAYAVFKRQSRLTIPYIFALFETVLLVILLEILPEFIDELGIGWFLLLNFLIALSSYLLIVVYSLYCEFKEEELNRLNF
ncbi:hypothetical protein PVAND_007271 [Polypedilum vanderplanki]|uniref:Transmembrane protein n=1 Tax=Polypedilum vanderplanki TaxID=319348 RepID=A0A9J6C5R1_POLVA|nr:hypothetical protein PVAND_007271 [Polypedilum vanderplanki]